MTPTPAVVELHPDVSRAANLGESLTTAVTVTLPDPARLPRRPVVCFAWPGGGYSRRYFTFDVPGSAGGGQAGWHATRGWIFVSCDHVAVGDSDAPADPKRLTFENLAASNRATVDTVLARLAAGTLVAGFPPVVDAFTIGIGQSMGACLLIVQQAVHRTFDAIGVLGFSAIHTVLWMPPDARDLGTVSVERGSDVELVTEETAARYTPGMHSSAGELPATTAGFHFDDEPPDVVAADMIGFPTRRGQLPPWASATIPPCAVTMMSPGAVAGEAAANTAPVIVGIGERDVCPEPLAEPRAYERATDVTVFVCPRMSHMHNFAGSRERMWRRLAMWGDGLAAHSSD